MLAHGWWPLMAAADLRPGRDVIELARTRVGNDLRIVRVLQVQPARRKALIPGGGKGSQLPAHRRAGSAASAGVTAAATGARQRHAAAAAAAAEAAASPTSTLACTSRTAGQVAPPQPAAGAQAESVPRAAAPGAAAGRVIVDASLKRTGPALLPVSSKRGRLSTILGSASRWTLPQ